MGADKGAHRSALWPWHLLALATQLVWGVFPVACRYFQNQAQPTTLTGLQVSLLVNAIGGAAFLLCYSAPRRLLRLHPPRVEGQRGMLLLDWLRYRLSRLRRAGSLQALLPEMGSEDRQQLAQALLPAGVLQAAGPPAPEPAVRGAALRRPSLIEDTTSGGLDASQLPQAVQISLSIGRPASRALARRRRRLNRAAAGRLPAAGAHGGLRGHLQALAQTAPNSPRAWQLLRSSAAPSEPQASEGPASAPALGGVWPAWLSWHSGGSAVGSSPMSRDAGLLAAEAGMAYGEHPAGPPQSLPSPPLTPTAARRLQRWLPPGSPRTPRAGLRQPLLPATVDEGGSEAAAEERSEGGWVAAPAAELEASVRAASQPDGGMGASWTAPLEAGREPARATQGELVAQFQHVLPARQLPGEKAPKAAAEPGGQQVEAAQAAAKASPWAWQEEQQQQQQQQQPEGAEEEAAAAAAAEERVFLTLKPLTLYRRAITPWALAASSAAALATLALALIFSVRFTHAYWCQMLFLLSPLFVALLCRFIYKMPLPPRLWPSLAAMLAGSAMVILGKGGTRFGLEGLTWRDAVGLSLALVSAASLASYMILVQRTKDLLTGEEILLINYGVQAGLSAVLTLSLEAPEWRRVGRMSGREWGELAVVAVVIQLGANLAQQETIRRLGAPQVATFLALRLVAAVAVSGPLLGEPIGGMWEMGGVLVVIVALTWHVQALTWQR